MASESGQTDFPAPAKLSEEETKVLKECKDESFFKRSLPLSLGAIIGVQYLVRTGKVARHPQFGALPKSIIAGGLAFIAGKISYLPECRNKILEQIPDSNMAIAIRKAQTRGQPDARQQFPAEKPPSSGSGEHTNTGLGYSADTRSFEGLNDSDRPSMDNEVKMPDSHEEKKSVTYDDLRRKNRDQYKDQLSKSPPAQPDAPSYKDSPYMPQKVWPNKPPSNEDPPTGTDPPAQGPPKRKRTNMWGDVIED